MVTSDVAGSVLGARRALEERLLQEADSLGALLDRLRRHIPPALIGERGWESILSRARELPVALAAFPFGFECHLRAPESAADLAVSLTGESRAAAFYRERGRRADASPAAAGLARFIEEFGRDETRNRRLLHEAVWLEYDVHSAPPETRPEPGFFLHPVAHLRSAREDERACWNPAGLVEMIVAGAGWKPDPAERRPVEQLCGALTPDVHVMGMGAFPSRERKVGLVVEGFPDAPAVASFLERTGWPGSISHAASTVRLFEECGAFADVSLDFSVRSSGIEPSLGVNFHMKRRADPPTRCEERGRWPALLNALAERGLAAPEKLSALAGWPDARMLSGETLIGRTGAYMLLMGVTHFKLGLVGEEVAKAKAYLIMGLCSPEALTAIGS